MAAGHLREDAPITRRIAALRPSCASDLTTKSSQGDDELGPAQAALDEAAQKRGPEGLGLAGADVQPHDLPLALRVGRHGDYGCHADDPAALALLEAGRVLPQVGPVAFKRAVEEGVHAVVDVLAQLADRALADAAQAQRQTA